MLASTRSVTTHTDLSLLQRIRRQDQSALLELYQAYGALVYGLALRVLQNTGWAEEVTQDIFLKIWQQPERWNPALGQFNSWLLTITRNAAIDRLRKERRPTASEFTQTETTPTLPIGNDTLWYDSQVLIKLLEQLPNEQRLLIDLAFYQGYTHSELAENLNLPLGTVKTRLRMGLQKLRSLWEEQIR